MHTYTYTYMHAIRTYIHKYIYIHTYILKNLRPQSISVVNVKALIASHFVRTFLATLSDAEYHENTLSLR
jgi:hypothetical protein